MNIYEKLIENPLFFKWIYYPTEELKSYWDFYLKQNPDESSLILEFKEQFEKYLKHENKRLSESDKKKLAEKIIRKLKTTRKKKQRKIFIKLWMRYAAVALIFFSIGSSLVYLFMSRRQTQFIVQNSSVPTQTQDPVLITGDGQEIKLNQGKSELDYSGEKAIIVDNKRSLFKENNGKTAVLNRLIMPYGNQSEIVLADNSKVWLNAGSMLIYPTEFTDKTREVLLVGEAFFDVEKNVDQPFVVKTKGVEVHALGTSFNVSAYPEDYSIQTVLSEGSVKIKRSGAGFLDKGTILKPGQLAYFNKNNNDTRIYEVNVENYTLWTKGLLSFSNTDLSRIVKKIERFYNIGFQFDDPLKGSIQITGKMDITKDKPEVFEYLSKLTGLDFIRIDDSMYIIK